MSKYSDQITATGSLISFDAPFGGVFDSLSVPITPTQDLHGYSSPWPAGGGVNKYDMANWPYSTSRRYWGTDVPSIVTVLNSLAAGTYTITAKIKIEALTDTSDNRTYGFLCTGVSVDGRKTIATPAVGTVVSISKTFTLSSAKVGKFTHCYWYAGTASSTSDTATISEIGINVGSDATYYPYSNICPITGWTGAKVSRTGKNLCSVNELPANPTYYWGSNYSIIVNILNTLPTGTYTMYVTQEVVTMPSNGKVTHGRPYLTALQNGTQTPVLSYSMANDDSPYVGKMYRDGGTFTITEEIKGNFNNAYFYCDQRDTHSGNGRGTYNVKEIQIELGSTATTYEPYTGNTYAVDWTSQAGTVYGGTLDVVTGVLTVDRASISSYAGETLPGAWISDRDVYAPGASPTTGAQVVYELATPVTYQLTPTQISALVGSNNVWVDTSAVITLIYRLLQVDRQTDRTSIGKKAESLDVLGKFSSISKVEVNVTENLFYEAGDSSGRTLTVDCPFGTQEMADNLLAMFVGFYYQPYEARKAILDPAFEIGDGVTVGNVYGGIFSIHQKCGPLHLADLSAPGDEEIDHEYKFTPAAERKIERRLNNMESELSVQAGEISAKVDRQGGDPSSVSWLMDSDVFKVAVDGSDVLTVDENGLTVNGDGNFTGNVQAKNIRYGGSNGTFSGGGISGGSIGTSKFTSGINVSLGNADFSADVFSGAATATYTKAKNLYCVGRFLYNGKEFSPAVYYLLDQNNNVVRLRVLQS